MYGMEPIVIQIAVAYLEPAINSLHCDLHHQFCHHHHKHARTHTSTHTHAYVYVLSYTLPQHTQSHRSQRQGHGLRSVVQASTHYFAGNEHRAILCHGLGCRSILVLGLCCTFMLCRLMYTYMLHTCIRCTLYAVYLRAVTH